MRVFTHYDNRDTIYIYKENQVEVIFQGGTQMNRFAGYFSEYFGVKDISHFPVYQKNKSDMSLAIALSGNTLLLDRLQTPRNIDWKSI
jgi:hypothetical protein